MLMGSIAVSMGLLAVIGAVVFNAKLVDPDGFIGPSYLRLPTILALGFGIDLVPRTLWVSRANPRRMPAVFRERVRTHWTKDRIVLVVTGILSFYITYVSYRNLKSQLPFILGHNYKFDRPLFSLDKAIFLGHEPAIVLHDLLGDGISAEFLSSVYLWFLPLVPLALAVWLVWSRNLGFGYWFACSQCIAWTLGTISYFALPTLGPGFQHPWLYQTVEDTSAGHLMNSLANSRVWAVNTSAPSLENLTSTLSGVAGFASLHVAITLLVALDDPVHDHDALAEDRVLGQHLLHRRRDPLLRLALRRRRHRRGRDRAGLLLRRGLGERPVVHAASGCHSASWTKVTSL